MKAKLTVDAGRPGPVISKNIYGHFSEHLGRCVYEGLWVGEDSPIPNTRGIRRDVTAALRRMGVPLLRWPGGCFADEYHWMDGVGPRERRKRMVNTHWGGVVEDNAFGTHEFMDLCAQVGCEPYICGNVGSGSVREMQEWVEYMTFGGESPMAGLRRENGRAEPWALPYFGIGNESWGCGGNMTPEQYASEFRRYNTYVRNFGENKVQRIACGPNEANYRWTEVLMREAGGLMDGLSLHYYTLPTGNWQRKGSAVEFEEDEWFGAMEKTLRMRELVERHSEVMDRYDPEKRVFLAVDEWGAWYDVEPGTNPGFLYQQNTLRDAVVAGVNLNIFNNRCDRVRMANIAQLANVLQAPILTDGADMLLTPTFHVFEMYCVHQGARLLPSEADTGEYRFGGGAVPRLSASASLGAGGAVHISLCNLDPKNGVELECALNGFAVKSASGRVVASGAMNARNTFESPDLVHAEALREVAAAPGGVAVRLPPMSVAVLELS